MVLAVRCCLVVLSRTTGKTSFSLLLSLLHPSRQSQLCLCLRRRLTEPPCPHTHTQHDSNKDKIAISDKSNNSLHHSLRYSSTKHDTQDEFQLIIIIFNLITNPTFDSTLLAFTFEMELLFIYLPPLMIKVSCLLADFKRPLCLQGVLTSWILQCCCLQK